MSDEARPTRVKIIERAGPTTGAPEADAEWLDRLERAGVVRRPRRKLPPQWLSRRPRVAVDVVEEMLREREEGP